MIQKPASTGSFTQLWAKLGEGLEGWGGETKAQEHLLTLKVPLTPRITLNLLPHTAVSETIRAVDKSEKSDKYINRNE